MVLRKRSRILFVSHTSGLNGSERSLLCLLKGLDKHKYEPLVLLSEEGLLRDKIAALGIETVVYPLKRWIPYRQEHSRRHFREVFGGLFSKVRFLSRFINDKKIDLVYSNSIVVIDDAIAAKLRGVPHIRHIRNFLFDNPYFKSYLPVPLVCALLKALSCQIITGSNAVARSYNFDNSSGPNGKMKVVYNGVDFDEFAFPAEADEGNDLRAELGLGPQTKIVTLVGRYQKEKGVREFIEAAKIVTSRLDDVAFVLIGHKYPRTFPEFEALAAELGIQDKIHFLDFRESLISEYKSTDVLVLASWIETSSRTIIEAMAAGKSVVATKCGGPVELVVEGETGHLVATGSAEELAEAIVKLLGDDHRRERMGRLGQERASELFRAEDYVSAVQEVIGRALGEKRPRFNREELTEISRAFFESLPQLGKIAGREVSRKIFNMCRRRAAGVAGMFSSPRRIRPEVIRVEEEDVEI